MATGQDLANADFTGANLNQVRSRENWKKFMVRMEKSYESIWYIDVLVNLHLLQEWQESEVAIRLYTFFFQTILSRCFLVFCWRCPNLKRRWISNWHASPVPPWIMPLLLRCMLLACESVWERVGQGLWMYEFRGFWNKMCQAGMFVVILSLISSQSNFVLARHAGGLKGIWVSHRVT